MKCAICKNGETRSGAATVTLERGGATVVIKDVPAEVCRNCGEYYLSEDRTAEVMGLAEEAEKRGAEVAVLRYRPASARSR
jgi:YgiT-type zinc finger domain-containing protein